MKLKQEGSNSYVRASCQSTHIPQEPSARLSYQPARQGERDRKMQMQRKDTAKGSKETPKETDENLTLKGEGENRVAGIHIHT